MVNDKYRLLDLAYKVKQPKQIDYTDFLKTVPFKFRKSESIKNLWGQNKTSTYNELLGINNL